MSFLNNDVLTTLSASNIYYPLVSDGLGKIYREPVIVALSPVLNNIITTPPVSPSIDDSYIVPNGATGVWSSNIGKIATWSGSSWVYYTPLLNDKTSVTTGANVGLNYIYNGTDWVLLTNTNNSQVSVVKAKAKIRINDFNLATITNQTNIATAVISSGSGSSPMIMNITFSLPLTNINYQILGEISSNIGEAAGANATVVYETANKTINGFTVIFREIASTIQNCNFEFIILQEATVSGTALSAGTGISIVNNVVSATIVNKDSFTAQNIIGSWNGLTGKTMLTFTSKANTKYLVTYSGTIYSTTVNTLHYLRIDNNGVEMTRQNQWFNVINSHINVSGSFILTTPTAISNVLSFKTSGISDVNDYGNITVTEL